ncbi:beta-glucosidase BglX [Cohnella sp. WQ 127256]|uniref:beta-glucosidase BglX n=1 Tax=Cohnella sp. WQ 127256 TaxID=2938790 RepID=UPI002119438A|nr:beta-glucosidase BglX [Cohnella sp. WQ 127256]
MKFMYDDVEVSIARLLEQMTLEEKIGQLMQLSPSLFGAFGLTKDEIIAQMVNGELSYEEFSQIGRDYHEDKIRAGLIGSMGGVTGAAKVNELQRIAVEESRLGIPILFGLDVIHGYRTIFPIPLAEACSWEPELARETAKIAAKEAAAAGLHWTFAPMVDIARDPRWGRISEGAGEDPYLGSLMAAARVKGFQGEDLSNPSALLACAKHLVAYGGAVGGRDYNTVDMSLQMLHDVYLPPFKAAAEAGVGTFMSAFNDLNGIPCTANRYLLSEVLRKQYGFQGFVVSDANSVAEVMVHGYAETRKEASKKALMAGVDMDMSHGTYEEDLPQLLAEEQLSHADLNEAVRRVLRMKFALGLFENPYRTTPEQEQRLLLAPEHLTLAREAAQRSIVLLKNENEALPLSRGNKKIALIGPLADNADEMLGAWAISGNPNNVVTIREGIAAAAGGDTQVVYAKGCEIDDNKSDFTEALEAARGSDVVIAVVGESSNMSGEAASRLNLGLPGRQEELLKALHAAGKPLIVVLVNGRPLSIPWAAEHADAIVEAWQLGTLSGHALADVLFGDYNPSGKLVATFPHSAGQVPVYYNHPNTGRPTGEFKFTMKYLDGSTEPLYPFGYGLSYTTFAYERLTLSQSEVTADGRIIAEVDITNTGNRFGEEVVQLYVSDVVASRVRPIKELKGFAKVALQPGECKRVAIELEVASLGFHNEFLEYVVEPGRFMVYVGPNSKDGIESEFVLIS